MKRPNPQDSTLRNVRAARKRIAALERSVAQLQAQQRVEATPPNRRSIEQEIHTLKGRFENIENAFYEFFSGIEAAQIASAEGRPRKGRKR